MRSLVVTGSSGLIGSEVVSHFSEKGYRVHGIDNNMRADFFGREGDTRWNQKRLVENHAQFNHHELDIRDREKILLLFKELKPEVVIHAAAQPSHDLAASRPFDDFEVNAVGTLNLLEATHQYAPESIFIYMSTNKVYGDGPNSIPLKELSMRWEYADPTYANGIPETFSVDACKHSLFGASKLAADIMVQEYGRYFDMKTCCLRGGCLTGPNHSGVELHGFLNYLIKCNLSQRLYKVFGYLGKQVRDNIHSVDVAGFMEAFIENPKSGAVYNLGGGRENSCSILEAFRLVSEMSGIEMKHEYVDQARSGDHICYISDLTKIKADYPKWKITKSLHDIFEEIVASVRSQQ